MASFTQTRIYILDTPHLDYDEMLEFLKEMCFPLPKEDSLGYYYVARTLGKERGKYLLSLGWKFAVKDVKVKSKPIGFTKSNNPYIILEVPIGASLSEIKKAYKRLCFKHHPDMGGDIEIMKRINIAYHKLV